VVAVKLRRAAVIDITGKTVPGRDDRRRGEGIGNDPVSALRPRRRRPGQRHVCRDITLDEVVVAKHGDTGAAEVCADVAPERRIIPGQFDAGSRCAVDVVSQPAVVNTVALEYIVFPSVRNIPDTSAEIETADVVAGDLV